MQVLRTGINRRNWLRLTVSGPAFKYLFLESQCYSQSSADTDAWIQIEPWINKPATISNSEVATWLRVALPSGDVDSMMALSEAWQTRLLALVGASTTATDSSSHLARAKKDLETRVESDQRNRYHVAYPVFAFEQLMYGVPAHQKSIAFQIWTETFVAN